ncbi:hypothetical protein FO519_002774 [Halicephalobus sp. NKZ332]|nr:hypothetical protein FO519_002774 [Halicephalobus sp. NKZ332]
MLKNVIPIKWAISLCIVIVLLAIFPAFGILGYYRSLIIMTPVVWTLVTALIYSFKFILYTSVALMALMIYADIAFPWIIRKFSEIFTKVELNDEL